MWLFFLTRTVALVVYSAFSLDILVKVDASPMCGSIKASIFYVLFVCTLISLSTTFQSQFTSVNDTVTQNVSNSIQQSCIKY